LLRIFSEDTLLWTVPYNLKGQKIKTLLNENQEAGYHNVVWMSNNNKGEQVSSGIYLYKVTSGTKKIVQKMMLMK